MKIKYEKKSFGLFPMRVIFEVVEDDESFVTSCDGRLPYVSTSRGMSHSTQSADDILPVHDRIVCFGSVNELEGSCDEPVSSSCKTARERFTLALGATSSTVRVLLMVSKLRAERSLFKDWHHPWSRWVMPACSQPPKQAEWFRATHPPPWPLPFQQ